MFDNIREGMYFLRILYFEFVEGTRFIETNFFLYKIEIEAVKIFKKKRKSRHLWWNEVESRWLK